MKKRILIISLAVTAIVVLAAIITSCKKHDMLGTFEASFTFSWDGKNFTAANLNKHIHRDTIIRIDTIIKADTIARIDTVMSIDTASPIIYLFDTTEATNLVNIKEIKFFLYGISLVDIDGNYHSIDGDSIHYIDIRNPSTLSWHSAEKIPTGVYDSVVFYFGLSEEDNVNGRFTDPPLNNMDWPEAMGGGYHFMMTDVRWRNTYDKIDTFYSFGLHITAPKGIRLAYANRIYITEESVIKKSFNMALDKWFNVEPIWDCNVYGGRIMGNPEAQRVLLDRVNKVFSVK